ncbi:helicase [Dermabacteraceae bacterium P13136]
MEALGQDGYAAAREATLNAHYTAPELCAPIWKALQDLGFTGGEVLEPGSGMGTFIGLAPENTHMTGIEIDPVSAELSSHLYPSANIKQQGFENFQAPNASFDAAIGNVPFGAYKLHDKTHNVGNHSIHNHFIIKSLNLVKPGGLAAFITSAYTLDAQNPAARREMAAEADLVGAIRLPNKAHHRAAGTDALSDILIFRKRLPAEEARDTEWVTTTPIALTDANGTKHQLRINNHFAQYPERVLGDLGVTRGVRGSYQLGVDGGSLVNLGQRLESALNNLTTRAREEGLTSTPTNIIKQETVAGTPNPSIQWDGHIAQVGNDFVTYQNGQMAPLQVPKSPATRTELRALLSMRDKAAELLDLESRTLEDSPEITRLRSILREELRGYHTKYGPVGRFKLSSNNRQIRPTAVTIFADRDPFAYLVKGLERFDAETQTAREADMLTCRVLSARKPIQGADTIEDAIAISLDTTGRIDLDKIADLRGITSEEARTELTGHVYQDPATHDLVSAGEYLSGDVRAKLDQALHAAEEEPGQWQENITALQAVIPADLTSVDIEARIGAPWISAKDHERFLHELLDVNDDRVRVQSNGDGRWQVNHRGLGNSPLAAMTWGTSRRNAAQLFEAIADQRIIQVHDKDDEGKLILNPAATAAANEKADAIRERFSTWVWEDPERAERLTANYNKAFNSLVLRDYTREGQALTFPGMAETFRPMPHQRTAIARMINEPAVGLFHQVGAGKTAEMIIGSYELKRLGLVQKPAIVVPNHMLEQVASEAVQIYPNLALLAAGKDDLSAKARKQFIAKIATNNWDCIIMTRSAFQKLDLSPDFQEKYLKEQIDQRRAALEQAKAAGGNNFTVKSMERSIKASEGKLRKLLDQPRDVGISFESTGIDYLCIDEAHDYKNLATESNIRGAAIAGAERASDLHAKLEYLRTKYGNRVATFATGTPIANSVAEVHVMQRYLRPDLLQKAGVASFDAWAANFGKTVTSIEMAPEGNSFRTVQRFAQFQNVPELLRMMHTFADVKLADDLDLPTPKIRKRSDGRRAAEMQMVPPSLATIDYIEDLGRRADVVRNGQVAPDVDNMAKISVDGRKAALHPALVGIDDPEAESGKVARAAASIAETYHQYKDTHYSRDDGTTSPGALQIVFADLNRSKDSTLDEETGQGYEVYKDLRARLVDAGIPNEKIRLMQDAKNDQAKAQLFADCRNGEVAVLMGSTITMGTGTNVQRRAIALHHLDCPWRPCDIEQREGRVIRQLNENPEVSIHRWATQRSFDAYMWQTVERKSAFINQIMRGTLDMRTIEDISSQELDYSEIKALAADNPLLIDKARLEGEVQRLTRLERAHELEQFNARSQARGLEKQIATIEEIIPRLDALAAKTQDTKGEKFTATINGHTTNSRAEAAQQLANVIQRCPAPGYDKDKPVGAVMTLAGHEVHLTVCSLYSHIGKASPWNPMLKLEVPGALSRHAIFETKEQLIASGHHAITTLEGRISAIGRDVERMRTELPQQRKNLQDTLARTTGDFKHATLLELTRKQLADVNAKIARRTGQVPHEAENTVQQTINIVEYKSRGKGKPSQARSGYGIE